MAHFSRSGQLIERWGTCGEGAQAAGGQFSEPHGIAVAPNGDVFVCDRYNFRVQVFDAERTCKSMWNTSGPLDNSAHYNLGIAVASNGSVYVTDHYQHVVQKYQQ